MCISESYFSSEYLSLANPGGEYKTQGLGIIHCLDFVWVTLWETNFCCCRPPFRRCCTAAAEAGNALETANQSPGDATIQQPPKENRKEKKKSKKDL